MANITRETYEANGIEVIADKLGKLWLNERHAEKKLGHKNLPALTNQYPKEYCVFIRINPDTANFNICKEINKIHRHINQSTIQQTEQKTKKSLIDNLSKGLLELEFKQNN